ncbi:SOS response-associated peptidase [Micromonospora pattaloongensis]|nr:SOS response-associated peptidase [Micromonospora pattaloongensis]
MCGRYATTRSSGELSALFESLDETGAPLRPDYNVAPTDPVPIVRMSQRAGGRVLSVARWGFVPPWADDPRVGGRMINARAETVATSRAYGPSFARRRCLVPADGWYEWVRGPGGGRRGAQPYFMTPRDGGVLAFAGLWSTWGGGAQPLLTCTVLTTDAVGELARVHDRMPVLLPRERWGDWLAGRGDAAAELLAGPPARLLAGLDLRPVGPAVGDVRNNGPQLVAAVQSGTPEEPAELTLF